MIDIIKRLIVEFLLDTVFFYTGEFFLLIVTFGHKKIQWNTYLHDRPRNFFLYYYISVLIGGVVWLFILFLFISHIHPN